MKIQSNIETLKKAVSGSEEAAAEGAAAESACCEPGCCGGAAKTRSAEARTESEAERLKREVREHYAEIARNGEVTGCGCGIGGDASFSEDYSQLAGHAPEADLGLGCGLPTEAADMRPGETVVDLGSGAGNDAFVARALVGAQGRVVGVDMTEAMIEKAKGNNARLGFANVEFRLGEIEDLPLRDGVADAVISNCVLNLVPDKGAAFAEAFRVLKPGGRLAVSDMVLEGALPEALRGAAEAYVGCVGGALQKKDYLEGLRRAGFAEPRLVKEREIRLPDDFLLRYLSVTETQALRRSGVRILSVTVRAEKPE